mmetsp:Transcript_2653/g.3959  ORF Transcript_2653/g.3959 Transcript_2653/m.3959 type:complete len:369 (-) Transcript_2653:99-1205(-)
MGLKNVANPGAIRPNDIASGPLPFDSNDHSSPKPLATNHFRWWADDAASNLRAAVDSSFSSDQDDGSVTPHGSDDPVINKVTRKISSQIAKQISTPTYADLIQPLKSKIRILERACQCAIKERNSDEWSETSDSPMIDSADIIASKMESIILRRVPEEISTWLAKEILKQLCEGEQEESSDDEASLSGSDMGTIAFPGSENDTLFNKWSSNVKSPAKVEKSAKKNAPKSALRTKKADEDESGHTHRKFYDDNSDVRLQNEAYKKFKLVCVEGRGFRVMKHNHNGGKKQRILKFNEGKRSIFWESSKILGGEYVDSRKICRLDREETVVYVWHKAGRHNKKKMVGFETQREYDARVLELALLFLTNQSS